MELPENGLIIRRRDRQGRLVLQVQEGTDRQSLFERKLMDSCDDDWFWDDDFLDVIGIVEYRLYEQDCAEVNTEDAK